MHLRKLCGSCGAKLNDRFLEQRINIKFCAKLGKNANHSFAMLSEPYGGEAMKKSSD
jgi:hypothetical protein